MVNFLLSEELLFHRPSGGRFFTNGRKTTVYAENLRASHNHYNLLKHTQLYRNKRKYYIKYNLNQRKII